MTGYEGSNDIQNLTLSFTYAPTLFNHFNLGLRNIYHQQWYSSIYTEMDLLSGFYFSYTTGHFFKVSLDYLFFTKLAHIYSVSNAVPYLRNNSLATGIDLAFKPFTGFDVGIKFTSYTPYRYMLFIAPDFIFYGSYDFGPFIIGQELDFKYIDLFTLSSNYNGLNIRTYIRFLIG